MDGFSEDALKTFTELVATDCTKDFTVKAKKSGKLYLYREMKKINVDTLIEGKLYVPPCGNFNDVFDCDIHCQLADLVASLVDIDSNNPDGLNAVRTIMGEASSFVLSPQTNQFLATGDALTRKHLITGWKPVFEAIAKAEGNQGDKSFILLELLGKSLPLEKKGRVSSSTLGSMQNKR